MLNRLTADRGRPASETHEGPRAFPDSEQLASLRPDDLRRHGFSTTKARTIVETAQAMGGFAPPPPVARYK
jgi:3-methyladenine DNA glycosylase/8-oxoguanine DNA glycosylase